MHQFQLFLIQYRPIDPGKASAHPDDLLIALAAAAEQSQLLYGGEGSAQLLEGRTTIGAGCEIHSGARIVDFDPRFGDMRVDRQIELVRRWTMPFVCIAFAISLVETPRVPSCERR